MTPSLPTPALHSEFDDEPKKSSPSLMYRAFLEEKYAHEFVNYGRFRMGRLDHYRAIEDGARSDPAEGLGKYIDQKGVSVHFELGNTIYALCCSAGDVNLDFLRQKMGQHIVRINDPNLIVQDVNAFLGAEGIKTFGTVQWRAVSYSKGEVISEQLDEMNRAELSIAQKSPSFSEEREHRLCAILNDTRSTRFLPKYLSVNIGHKLTYAEILAL